MTKLEKTSALIAEMSTEEKAQILAELLQYFYFPATGISHTPGVCGGRACIRARHQNTRLDHRRSQTDTLQNLNLAGIKYPDEKVLEKAKESGRCVS